MAVLGSGSWTLNSGPRVCRAGKIKLSYARFALASGSYKNGIKLPPVGVFGFKRNVESLEVVATATGTTQGMVWVFDRVNRKMRAYGMGSASLATEATGRKRLVELTSRFQAASASGFKAQTLHIQGVGW